MKGTVSGHAEIAVRGIRTVAVSVDWAALGEATQPYAPG